MSNQNDFFKSAQQKIALSAQQGKLLSLTNNEIVALNEAIKDLVLVPVFRMDDPDLNEKLKKHMEERNQTSK